MAKLGRARLHVEQGAVTEGAKDIAEIWKADANFLRVNAPLFNAGLPPLKRAELQRVLEERQTMSNVSQELLEVFRDGAATERIANMPQDPGADVVSQPSHGKAPTGTAAEFYSSGRFQPAAGAAQKLTANAPTEAEGLYWEIRSAQKLATNALARASRIDSDSPEFHVLLGDIYRQRKYLEDAEQEYRKALALNAEDTGALFGLSLTLLAKPDLDEALRVTQSALTKHPDDPEFNAVMGEILSIQHNFAGAEPYLKKGLSTKPELFRTCMLYSEGCTPRPTERRKRSRSQSSGSLTIRMDVSTIRLPASI